MLCRRKHRYQPPTSPNRPYMCPAHARATQRLPPAPVKVVVAPTFDPELSSTVRFRPTVPPPGLAENATPLGRYPAYYAISQRRLLSTLRLLLRAAVALAAAVVAVWYDCCAQRAGQQERQSPVHTAAGLQLSAYSIPSVRWSKFPLP